MKCIICDKKAIYIHHGHSVCGRCFKIFKRVIEEQRKENEEIQIKNNEWYANLFKSFKL